MSVSKGFGQYGGIQKVSFKLLDTAGTPSITGVFPRAAASDISVVDTATGRATVTIKNFKGQQGVANIQLTPQTTSLSAAAVSRSYSGDDLSFEISVEDDSSTLTDSSVDVSVEVY